MTIKSPLILRISLLILSSFYAGFTFSQEIYRISADLVNVKNDQVKVVVKAPAIKEERIAWVMPQVIPGSYSIKDFGRFISDVTAFDKKGKKLKVEKEGNNVFYISNANRLDRLEYLVDDTWDAENDNFINQSGGTNIDAGKNFVINHFGFWGYFEGYKLLPYEITVTKPSNFYASTALEVKSESPEKDILIARDYVRLVDNPVMYCIPDTVSFMSGNTKIHISVYSETGLIKSQQVKQYINPLAASLTDFFGQMPVDRYHFIMHFPVNDKKGITAHGTYGALEHSFSSFYFLPEIHDEERVKSMILSIAAHEFLHILTPLNVHSEEVANFDFRNPKMSKHLWMYEGVTEYFADLVQVRSKLTTLEEFADEVQSKIKNGAKFPDVSFTEMSQNILSTEFKNMYGNVYQKGAMIGFLLDIRLHELSGGKMGLKDVMLQLKTKYGPDRPFKDDELIDVFVSLTYPEIRTYFNDYVIGDKSLPYQDYLGKVGFNYWDTKVDTILSLGMIKFNTQGENIVVGKTIPADNAFGLKNQDVVISINGKALTADNYRNEISIITNPKNDKEITLKIKRGDKEEVVKARPNKLPVENKHVLQVVSDPTDNQKQMRRVMFLSF
jgi:predicted metalloprotease with PDZ domain